MGIFSISRQVIRSSKNVYNQFVHKRPYLSQAVQVSFIMGTGDVIAQHFVEKKPVTEMNWLRTAQFAGMGFFVVGPCLRIWYNQLEKIFIRQNSKWKKASGKVILDQVLFAPTFLLIFTCSISMLQGLQADDIIHRVKQNYLSMLLTNYSLWPAAQFVNFSLIPLQYQVIFVQMIAIIWNTYLSTKLGSEKENQIKS